MDQRNWKSYGLKPDQSGWEPAEYNINIDRIGTAGGVVICANVATASP